MQNTQNEKQTFIDFSSDLRQEKGYYTRLSSENHPVYHKEASSILSDRFTIKISYEKRSYLIMGYYGITKLRNFSSSDFSGNEISYVKIEKVMHFQNSFYVRHFLTKKEEFRFSKIISNILSDIKYNPNLELN